MKNLVFFFNLFLICSAQAQNGFTTYTTNLIITGNVKVQTAFLVDNNSNKWIGFRTITSGTNIANAGLVKYDNSGWVLYNQLSSPAFPSTYVTSLAEDSNGNIWIGCDSGLVKFDGAVFTTYSTGQGLPVKLVKCVEVVGNQVYVGTNAGLSRFDGISFINYNVANGLFPNDTISCIKAETNNLLWIGGNNIMVEFDINGSFVSSFTNHVIPDSPGIINCIHIDSQNTKWLGTTKVGILKYTGSGFDNANTMYTILGASIPNKVVDISSGQHSGIAFIHRKSSYTGSFNGITELTTNNMVYQYFHPNQNFNFGGFIENKGSDLFISPGPTQAYSSINKIMYYRFDSINYRHPFGSVNDENVKMLDINNVSAGIANRGDMHWNIGGNSSRMYEVPKGSGKHSNYASGIWIGGLDNGGQLHGAAQTYRQAGVDFWPGPLDTIAGTIDTATSLNYDKIWKVSYNDINTFVSAFNSGSVVATPDMLNWPAHGTGNNAKNLAPFVDHNGDGLYNPHDGDYPKIKGDQALYYIFNDKVAVHSSSFTPMGIEVHGMAYAYGCPGVVNGHNELTYTTFYDYKIINRSSSNYHDVYVSMWSDVDLGYYLDDYIGSNVADNYGYAYNASGNDPTVTFTNGYGNYPPAQGINIVKGPIANLNDGVDNNNNGITDEPSEDCRMNTFNYYVNAFPGVPYQLAAPMNGQEYYNYMNGLWRFGEPFTCGGIGYNGTINTNWVYPGDPNNGGLNTDPANTCGAWIEQGMPGDRRMILSSGPFTLNAGQMQEVEYAFVTSFDSSSITNSNLLSVAKLKTDIQKINTFYNQVNKPNCLMALTTGITEVPLQKDFSIYPNPARTMITVASTINGTMKINYEIVDVLGKVVLSSDHSGSDKFSININDLNSGIYFLRLQVNNSVVVKKFVKE